MEDAQALLDDHEEDLRRAGLTLERRRALERRLLAWHVEIELVLARLGRRFIVPFRGTAVPVASVELAMARLLTLCTVDDAEPLKLAV